MRARTYIQNTLTHNNAKPRAHNTNTHTHTVWCVPSAMRVMHGTRHEGGGEGEGEGMRT